MNNEKLIEVKNLSKFFPGVKALSDFSFDLKKGEVHCLIGENGAGKSTFIKIISGADYPDNGVIIINNNIFSYLSPYEARKLGIHAVYQDDILIPQMSVAENIFFGSKVIKKKFFISYALINKKASEIADFYGIILDVEKTYEKLNPSEQQFTKILRALAHEPKILILDEPTSVFNKVDVEKVIEIVNKVKRLGVGVIYITHNLNEVIEIADRITILKDGQKVSTKNRDEGEFLAKELASEMVGRPIELFYKKKKHLIGEKAYEIKNFRLSKNTKAINFFVRKGEILGIGGLKGSGRTEILRAIFGADPKLSGNIYHYNKDITPRNPRKAIKQGMSLITEDKKEDGLFLNLEVAANISFVGLNKISKFFLNLKKEYQKTMEFVKKLNIKVSSLSQEVQFLSGGNQQKVVLAKWLFKGTDLILMDEPTQGIDVSSKIEIYKLISELAVEGKSIIMVSSDMPELIALSDRVIVIKNGTISCELDKENITEENILKGFIGEEKIE